MNKKAALVIGGTGDIGGGFAQLFSDLGWKVYAPVRDPASPKAVTLQALPGVYVSGCNVEHAEETEHYIRQLHLTESSIDAVILAAGTHKFDTDFPRSTEEEMVAAATDALMKANFNTKRNVVEALERAYGPELKKTVCVVISSHIVDKDFPNQTGYRTAMTRVFNYGEEVAPLFLKMITKKTEVVDTEANRRNLTKEKIGTEPDWSTVPKPLEYARTVLSETGLV